MARMLGPANRSTFPRPKIQVDFLRSFIDFFPLNIYRASAMTRHCRHRHDEVSGQRGWRTEET